MKKRRQKQDFENAPLDSIRQFIEDFEQIRRSQGTVEIKNFELGELMATSSYVDNLFSVVWRLNSRAVELLDELRSLTLWKRVTSKRFPPAIRSEICSYTFVAIRQNWSTISRDRRQNNIISISDVREIEEAKKSSTLRRSKAEQNIRVLDDDGVRLNISSVTLHHAVTTLNKVDREGGACLKLKLLGLGEREISQRLELTPNETRGHVRRAQAELKVILGQLTREA